MPRYSNGKGLVSKTSGRKALGVQVSSSALSLFFYGTHNFSELRYNRSKPGRNFFISFAGFRIVSIF